MSSATINVGTILPTVGETVPRIMIRLGGMGVGDAETYIAIDVEEGRKLRRALDSAIGAIEAATAAPGGAS